MHPGSGKSTLTDRLIGRIRATGDEVGVLAIDPTSPFTGGAILGDRVRMQDHATDPAVFIRSMATRGHLGGLALATAQAIRILDAAGKPWVLVETVGVGQVEVEIAEAADTTVVVVNPGWGDGVQANKAGLLEIADVFVVNKSDRPGDRRRGARPDADAGPLGERRGHHRSWRRSRSTAPGSTSCSRRSGTTGPISNARACSADRRATRLADEVRAIVLDRFARRVDEVCIGQQFDELVARVAALELDPYSAADELLGADA